VKRGPDAWIEWYLRERERIGPRSVDPVAQRGTLLAPRCRACPSRDRRQKEAGGWACARCGCNWPSRDAYTLKGQVQAQPRNDGAERALALFVDVGAALHRFTTSRRWTWEARAYLRAIQGGTLRDIAAHGAVHWPRAPFAWNKDRVCLLVTAGRAEWRRRLARAHLCDP
jgi:ribosomal protein L37AE/L43A